MEPQGVGSLPEARPQDTVNRPHQHSVPFLPQPHLPRTPEETACSTGEAWLARFQNPLRGCHTESLIRTFWINTRHRETHSLRSVCIDPAPFMGQALCYILGCRGRDIKRLPRDLSATSGFLPILSPLSGVPAPLLPSELPLIFKKFTRHHFFPQISPAVHPTRYILSSSLFSFVP